MDVESKRAPLHRGYSNKVLAGVCAGLSESFGIDAVVIRVFFALAALVSLGTVFWAYGLLWLLMPERVGGPSIAAKWAAAVKDMFKSTGGGPTPDIPSGT